MKRNLDSVQILRAVAVITVILHHASDRIEKLTPFQDGTKKFWIEHFLNTDVGAIGVDIFFIISGFIMAYTTHNKPSTRFDFIKRRFLRIYPLYWIFSLIFIALHFTPWIGNINIKTGEAIKSFLLYPSLIHYDNIYLLRPAFLAQGWTLIYEVIFYIIFAIFITQKPILRIITITAFFFTGAIIAGYFFPESAEGALFTNPILYEFSLGLLIGWAFAGNIVKLPKTMAIGLLIASITALLVQMMLRVDVFEKPRLIYFGIPAFAVCIALLLCPDTQKWRYPKFLKIIGDASYSIYLTHTIVLLLMQTAYIRITFMQDLSYDIYFLVMFIIMLSAGIAVYFIIEKPLLTFAKRRSEQPKTSI